VQHALKVCAVYLVDEMQGDQCRTFSAALISRLLGFFGNRVDDTVGFRADDHDRNDGKIGAAVKHDVSVLDAKDHPAGKPWLQIVKNSMLPSRNF
jgi:hypothetical protein